MKKVVQLHRKIAPELIALLEERYNILRHIQYSQPVGRRALASMLSMGERIVRAQVDFLKNAGMVDFSALGMTVTKEGQDILLDMAEYIRLLHNVTVLEEELAMKLHMKKVIIIPGDSDEDSAVQRELGRAAAGLLRQCLGDNMIIAVSGGSTMARVAEAVTVTAPGTLVVPARGGLGEQVESQANTIAAVMADKLGGRYRLLHIPDGVSEEALETIRASDANVRTLAKLIRRPDILMYGIGQAAEMAIRRGVDASILNHIIRNGAVGESLGQYCTLDGQIVYATSSLGLHLDDLVGIQVAIAVAGGRKKAEAIVAVCNAGHGGESILVTDEAAAKAIQNIIAVNSL
jgi:central glycolytic genes regulator